MWDESGCCTWQKWRCQYAEVPEGCPCSPGVIAVGEWTSAGNWQASLCIRKLIAPCSRVLCQLKSSSAGSWKRGQPHFCLEIGLRLLQALTLFSQLSLLLAQSPPHSRQVDEWDFIHINTVYSDFFKAYSVKTGLNSEEYWWDSSLRFWITDWNLT